MPPDILRPTTREERAVWIRYVREGWDKGVKQADEIFQEDLNQRKNEELASVLDKANRVVKQIFDQDKYDLIVREAVFAGPRVDITDKVIKAMNAGSGK